MQGGVCRVSFNKLLSLRSERPILRRAFVKEREKN